MVPKWQWDDCIIRNRTDYKTYSLDCIDRGEDPQPYHRFYKDEIRDTIYSKGIIQSRATLLKALEQLNATPQMLEIAMSTRKSPKKVKRSRASLPSAFHRRNTSVNGHRSVTPRDNPRHSLPSRTQRDQTMSTKTSQTKNVPSHAQTVSGSAAASGRSTPQPNTVSRQSLDGAASPRTSTNQHNASRSGDQFLDFYNSYMRTTSLTGSTKVSTKQGRSQRSKS